MSERAFPTFTREGAPDRLEDDDPDVETRVARTARGELISIASLEEAREFLAHLEADSPESR